MKLSYQKKIEDGYTTIKDVLKKEFHFSDRLITKLKRMDNTILLNGKPSFVSFALSPKDIVTTYLDYEEENSNIVATATYLDIVYEDDAYLIINKPPYLAVHPSSLHFSNNLSSGVKYYFDQIGLKKKIRIVNRLDKDTSGLVIFAKNEYVQERLIYQMKQHQFQKKYLGIVEGTFHPICGSIEAKIARKEGSIIQREVSEKGDIAITHYETKKVYPSFSLVEFSLLTGRTHQIRVHSSYLGHPLLGDTLYGNFSSLIQRQALHSSFLSFLHPLTHQPVSYLSSLPEDMKTVLNN